MKVGDVVRVVGTRQSLDNEKGLIIDIDMDTLYEDQLTVYTIYRIHLINGQKNWFFGHQLEVVA